jgi:hypothetical protein
MPATTPVGVEVTNEAVTEAVAAKLHHYQSQRNLLRDHFFPTMTHNLRMVLNAKRRQLHRRTTRRKEVAPTLTVMIVVWMRWMMYLQLLQPCQT